MIFPDHIERASDTFPQPRPIVFFTIRPACFRVNSLPSKLTADNPFSHYPAPKTVDIYLQT